MPNVESRITEKEIWNGPNPVKAEFLHQYMPAGNDLMVRDLSGQAMNKNAPARPGLYMVENAAAGVVRKIVVVK